MNQSNNKTYIFKALYPSTAKTIKVEAKDEEVAWDKAHVNRMIKGCIQLKLIGSR